MWAAGRGLTLHGVDSPALDREEGISSHHVGAKRLVGWGPTVSCVNSPALDRQERISSHHVGATRLDGWDPTVPCVNSSALDREERISSHHVGAERLVGEGPTVHRVDDTVLDEQEWISVHHVDAALSDRGSVSSQVEGATLFLEQGQTVRVRCNVLGLGSVHRSQQRKWKSRRLFTDVESLGRLRGHGTRAEARLAKDLSMLAGGWVRAKTTGPGLATGHARLDVR